MYRRFHDRFGTAGVVIGVIALIAALGGTAFAAAGLSGKQKKEVKAIAKSFQGKGPAGVAGANGTNGKDGAPGTAGKDGTNGTNGKSVVTGTATAGECPGSNPTGGATVEVAGEPATKKKVCNGKEGSPWTAGGTLPSKATETGTWTVGTLPAGAVPASSITQGVFVPISFPIPLEDELDGSGCKLTPAEVVEGPCEVHYLNPAGKEVFLNQSFEAKEVNPTDCGTALTPPGTADKPSARPGHLCIYAASAENLGAFQGLPLVYKPGKGANYVKGASTAGAFLDFAFGLEPNVRAMGTWAVTAPE